MEYKSVDLADCDIKFAQNEGTFSGYGNVFNVLDTKNDIVMPGAFANVIKSGNPVDVYVNHSWLKGALPVGSWGDLKEDSKGLIGDANIVMEMPSGKDAYWAVKKGLVKSLSIAAIPDESSIERNSKGNRLIYNYSLLKEISIVDSPANKSSLITSVKFDDDLKSIETIKEFEHYLRDVGNFSRDHAKMMVAQAKVLFGQRDAGNEVTAETIKALSDRLDRFAVNK